MAVHVRLRRIGKNPKGKPHFRISVFDERRGRDSKFIEELGFYNPVSKALKINKRVYLGNETVLPEISLKKT